MLYAKKDLFAEDRGRRVQVALAGQPIPETYVRLVDKADVLEEPLPPSATGRAATSTGNAGVIPAELEIDATEAAAGLARDHGIDLATVKGTGKGGRITEPDVQKVVDAALGEE
jgi:pyruvate/2-oxoglutarate dehydrogenase complex dihydrolipoamide acyltransferase (E2) component